MKQLTTYIALFVALVIFAGCQDVITLELPNGEERLVVDGWYTSDNAPQVIRLNRSANYFSNEDLPPETSAVVTIEDKTTGTFDTLSEENPGVYTTNNAGQVDHTYILHIATTDGEAYISKEQYLQEVSTLDTLYLLFEEASTFSDAGWEVTISSSDPGGIDNYYRWRIFVNDVYRNDVFDINIVNDDFVDGNIIEDIAIESIDEGPDISRGQQMQVGDTVRVEQLSISFDFYDYMVQIQRQTAFVGSIFDTPPEPIRGNMLHVGGDESKNPFGFFAASDISTREAIGAK